MQFQPTTLLEIFIAVTAFGVLLQAMVLLGMLIVGLKAWRRADALSEEMKTQVLPLLISTRHLLEDVAPRIKEAVGNLTIASEELRTQAENINSAVGSIVDKTRLQSERINSMVTGALDGVNHAANVVQQVVSVPARQISGVFNGLRAGLDTLLSKERKSHTPEDKDLFV